MEKVLGQCLCRASELPSVSLFVDTGQALLKKTKSVPELNNSCPYVGLKSFQNDTTRESWLSCSLPTREQCFEMGFLHFSF